MCCLICPALAELPQPASPDAVSCSWGCVETDTYSTLLDLLILKQGASHQYACAAMDTEAYWRLSQCTFRLCCVVMAQYTPSCFGVPARPAYRVFSVSTGLRIIFTVLQAAHMSQARCGMAATVPR
jgi:hypothetical protein